MDSIIAEYEVNAVNQYTIIDFVDGEEISLTYDNAGNLLYDGKNHYDWDARNRLTSAERVDGLIKWDYTYDDQNRRVAIETFTRESIEDNFLSEDLTKFIYNNWLLIAETDANGSVTREYSYSDDANGDAGVGKLIKFTDYTDKTGGLLLAESKNYFVINDNVGNITSVIDREGNIINSYAYSPFGELIVEQEQVKLNIGFNTKYEDESGLTYYNNRYYDSDLGRFISQDPIFEEGGVNLYNFVENDPINHWDILGNSCIGALVSAYTTESVTNELINKSYIWAESLISSNDFNYVVYEPNYWLNNQDVANQIASDFIESETNFSSVVGDIDLALSVSLFVTSPRTLAQCILSFLGDLVVGETGSVYNSALSFIKNNFTYIYFNDIGKTLLRNAHSIMPTTRYTSSTDFVEFDCVESNVEIDPVMNTRITGYRARGSAVFGIAYGSGNMGALVFNANWIGNVSHSSIIESQFSWVKNTYFIPSLTVPDEIETLNL